MSDVSGVRGERYLFVDALRGVAAVAVLFHHLLHNTVLEVPLRKILPTPIQFACEHGALGVQVFFVISGFVIAHSLRATEPTARAVGNFILRRQLRLDPPYWVVLALVLALQFGEGLLPGLSAEPLPRPRDLFSNLFYLQGIVGVQQIVGVAWTLCLEIQFYLLFILMLAPGKIGRRRGSRDRMPTVSVVLVFGLGAVSLTQAPHQRVFGAWFLPFWFYFASGVLCNWCLQGRARQSIFVSFIALFCAATIWQRTPTMLAGLLTVTTLFAVGQAGHLTDWLSSRPLQYFGKISYSLYLIHLPVLCVVMRAGYKLTHENRFAALGWLLLGGACSIVAAHCLHAMVEEPSMRFAAMLKPRGKTYEMKPGDALPAPEGIFAAPVLQ